MRYYLIMTKQMNRACEFQSTNRTNQIDCRAGLLLLCVFAVLAAGCSTSKPKPKTEATKIHQRGWIGGEFELAVKAHHWLGIPFAADPALPGGLASSNRTGLLITALSSNTPAREAGLREGDLILDLDHQPVTTIKAFRRVVDRKEPGTLLPVTVWREGKIFEYNVSVGRERFFRHVDFGFVLPFYGTPDLGRVDLWPNPGFSLGCLLGFEPSDDRAELGSIKGNYYRACTGKKYTRNDADWNAWLLIFFSSEGKNIQSQESVSATNAPPPADGEPAK